MYKNERCGMRRLAGILVLAAIGLMIHKGGLLILEQDAPTSITVAPLGQQPSVTVKYPEEMPESGGPVEKAVQVDPTGTLAAINVDRPVTRKDPDSQSISK